MAVDNARLYESECTAREVAEAAGARLALLADATRALTSSLELDVILGDLARLMTPAVADVCLIDLVEQDGSLRRAATAVAPGRAGNGPPGSATSVLPGGGRPDPALACACGRAASNAPRWRRPRR